MKKQESPQQFMDLLRLSGLTLETILDITIVLRIDLKVQTSVGVVILKKVRLSFKDTAAIPQG
jgi:hypothetical protein